MVDDLLLVFDVALVLPVEPPPDSRNGLLEGGNEKNLGSDGNCSDSKGGDSTFVVGVVDPDIGAVVDIFRSTGRCFFFVDPASSTGIVDSRNGLE